MFAFLVPIFTVGCKVAIIRGGASDSPAGGLDGEAAGEGPARARGARHAVTADDARVLRRLFWG